MSTCCHYLCFPYVKTETFKYLTFKHSNISIIKHLILNEIANLVNITGKERTSFFQFFYQDIL